MKKKIFIKTVFIGLIILLAGCNNSDNELSMPIVDKYKLDKGTEGSFQREVYNYYSKFGVVVIANATIADYKYNFDNVNPITIKNSSGNEADLKNALKVFREIFTDCYSESFVRAYTPFKIILCDEIIGAEDNKQLDYYVANGFIALAGVSGKLKELSAEHKKELKNKLNVDFWSKYLFSYSEKLKVGAAFYNVSKKKYGESGEFTEEDAYKAGFTDSHNVDLGGGFIYVYRFLNEREDVAAFIRFIFSNKEADLAEKFEKYPLIKKKYGILKNNIEKEFKVNVNDFFE